MNYQLISPVLGLLRLLLAAVLLCSLGLWLELLWFAATGNSDTFWQFSQARLAFAVVGTTLSCAGYWWAYRRHQPPANDHRRSGAPWFFALAAFVGAVSGLGLWELMTILAVHSEVADLLRALQHHSIFFK